MNKAGLIALTFNRLKDKHGQSQIDRTRLVACSKQALERLCDVVSNQPKLRELLTRRYDCTIENGAVDLTGNDFDDLHRSSLNFSRFYGIDDSAELNPYIWQESPHYLDGWLDPNFGYYTLRGSDLIVRTPVDGEEASSTISGNGRLYALAIPFVTDRELPESGELWQLASDLLANEYLKLAPTSAQ